MFFMVSFIFLDFFFFFKQKTAYEMRISDWSSDVCSSDLRQRRIRRRLDRPSPEKPVGLRFPFLILQLLHTGGTSLMHPIRRTLFKTLLASTVVGLFGTTAMAADQPYPSKPIKLVVPWSPGGATDILGRMIAKGLTERIGQTVVVENQAGAGGNKIGRAHV